MTIITWHPIDPATIPRERRVMLWSEYGDAYIGFVLDPTNWVCIGNEEPDELSNFTHWAECPAGPNGETP